MIVAPTTVVSAASGAPSTHPSTPPASARTVDALGCCRHEQRMACGADRHQEHRDADSNTQLNEAPKPPRIAFSALTATEVLAGQCRVHREADAPHAR